MGNGLPEQLRASVNEFSARADEICDTFADTVSERPTPDVIYHYTDEAGLRGILQSGKLWLTDIFNLNDPSELRHGVKHALSILQGHADDGPQEVKLFNREFSQVMTGSLEVTAHFFVCCFSDTAEDLGQWRAYAADGRGYALGFDGKLLDAAFAKHAHGPSTFGVTYDDKKLRELQNELIAKVIPLISGQNLSRDTIIEYMVALSVKLASSCLMTALFFKHPAYSNEKEYRFLEIHSAGEAVPDLKIRSRPYSLVRYREFDWKGRACDSLKKIVIGPAADPRIASKFAYECLREYVMGSVEISQSEIPYRSIL